MHPEFENPLLTWVNEMYVQALNVSPELIKEMGVRILYRVIKMLPNENKFI